MAGLKRKAPPSEGFDGLTDTDLRWFLGGGLNLTASGPGPTASSPALNTEARAYASKEAQFLHDVREYLALLARLYILTAGMRREFPQSPQWGAGLEKRAAKFRAIDQAMFELGLALKCESFDPQTFTESPEELHGYRLYLANRFAKAIEALKARFAVMRGVEAYRRGGWSKEFQALRADIGRVDSAVLHMHRVVTA